MDLIYLGRGREIRAMALSAWNKVKSKQFGCVEKDAEMFKALERYMDKLTDAKYIQTARA